MLLSNIILFVFQRLNEIFRINAESLGVGVQFISEIGHFVGDHLQPVNDCNAKLMRCIRNGGVHLANVSKWKLDRIKIAAPNGGDDVDLCLGKEL